MNRWIEKYRYLRAPEDVAGGGTPSPPSSSSSPPASSGASPSSPGSSASESPGTSSPASGSPSVPDSGDSFDFGAIFEPPAPSSEPVGVAPPPASPMAPGATPPVAPTPAPATGPAPAEPTAAAPVPGAAPGPQQQQAPASPGGAPDGSRPPAQDSGTQIDLHDPVALSRYLAQNEAAALDFASKQMFALSPQEIEALDTNVTEAIPRLLAKVFVKQQQYVLDQIGRMVPNMIQRQTVLMQRNRENEDKFYSKWPDIKRDLHGDTVRKYAAVYRQMHPNANLDQMTNDLGPMVMMALRIQPSAPGQPAGAARAPGQNPVAPNGRSPHPTPFAPAGGGPATSSQAPQQEPWEAIFSHGD